MFSTTSFNFPLNRYSTVGIGTLGGITKQTIKVRTFQNTKTIYSTEVELATDDSQFSIQLAKVTSLEFKKFKNLLF